MNIGLQTALKGLMAAQRQIDVAGHNLANADTEGYTRQRADQTASLPFTPPALHVGYQGAGQIGTGVQISQITRLRDQFIDRQLRTQSAIQGDASTRADKLEQIEVILQEPSERALNELMKQFFNGWQELSGHPESPALRINLREVAVNLAEGIQDLYDQLADLHDDMNAEMVTMVKEVNGISKQIASLNQQITASIAAGQNPNDLQDKRDLLLEQLSGKTDIQAILDPTTGAMNVYVGGQALVQDIRSYDLEADSSGGPDVVLRYAPNGAVADIRGGGLQGLMTSRDVYLSTTDLAGVPYKLNQLTQAIIDSVNGLHQAGSDLDGNAGEPFFLQDPPGGASAGASIRVNPIFFGTGGAYPGDPIASLNQIAAAGTPTNGVGDNRIALQIAQLQTTGIAAIGNFTFDGYFDATLTQVGAESQQQARKSALQTTLLGSIKDRQSQSAGVSTDEEMGNVIRFQKAYSASARMVSVIDQMLEQLMSMGVVGR